MAKTIRENQKYTETVNSYFLSNPSAADKLLTRANTEATQILKKFSQFYTGNIVINIYKNAHTNGVSIAGDLTHNGELIGSYDPVDRCFLDLNKIMLNKLVNEVLNNISVLPPSLPESY